MVCAIKRVKMKYTQRTIEAIWVLMLFSHVLRFFRLFLLSMFLFLNLRKKWEKEWEEGDKAQLWTLETFFSSCNTDLRRLAPIFWGLTPSCLMLHNLACSACKEKPQIETTYITLNLILEYVLFTSTLQ